MRLLSCLLVTVMIVFLSIKVTPTVSADESGSLSGTVYLDADLDAQRDANEAPAPGISVGLHNDKTGTLATTVTGPDGSYRFEGLEAGVSYDISASDGICAAHGYYIHYAVGGDPKDKMIDLGLPVRANAHISGTLFNDKDEDGIRDAVESGLANWYVDISASNYPSNVLMSCDTQTVADAEGRFAFEGLPNLNYIIQLSRPMPEGYDPGTPYEVTYPLVSAPSPQFSDSMNMDTIDLSEASSLIQDIGVRLLSGNGVIEGLLYDDVDQDNVRDEDEPQTACEGVSLYHHAPSIGTLEVIAIPLCVNNLFRIGDLAAGRYNVGIYRCGYMSGRLRSLQPWFDLSNGRTGDIEVQDCSFHPTPTPTRLSPAPPVGAPLATPPFVLVIPDNSRHLPSALSATGQRRDGERPYAAIFELIGASLVLLGGGLALKRVKGWQ